MHHFAPPMNRAPYNHPPQGYLSFEERRRRFEEIGTSPPTKDNIQQNRFLHDRKRRNDGEEIATTHTPKKICKSAVFLPPPPAASTTINVFPKEVINELKNKLDKRPNTVQPSSSIMAPPASCQKGLVQLMERNRKAPSYSTSSALLEYLCKSNSPSYSASTAFSSTAAVDIIFLHYQGLSGNSMSQL
uniref:Uncharacterized protein n=1 Tax=Panagrolaimus superbus TaxID=310955 RepID=A0A914YM66_9BILA